MTPGGQLLIWLLACFSAHEKPMRVTHSHKSAAVRAERMARLSAGALLKMKTVPADYFRLCKEPNRRLKCIRADRLR